MADDDDLVIEIDAETGSGESKETVVSTAAEDPVKVVKAQYQELERKAADEAAAREAAERRADESARIAAAARAEAEEAKSRVVDSQYETVTSGIEAAKSEAAAAEQDYKLAFEAGDAAKMATAQRQMARAEAKLLRYDEAKDDLESMRGDRAKQTERRVESTSPSAAEDPVEAYIRPRTAPTQAWLRKHVEFITDKTKNAKLTAAHYDALANEITVDTPQYFEHVEKFLGLKDKPRADNGRFRRAAPPAAPVHQSGSGVNGGREVRLTQAEARAATDGTIVWNYDDPSPHKRFKKGDPIGVQEFAKRKLKMTAQGLYDRSYTEA